MSRQATANIYSISPQIGCAQENVIITAANKVINQSHQSSNSTLRQMQPVYHYLWSRIFFLCWIFCILHYFKFIEEKQAEMIVNTGLIFDSCSSSVLVRLYSGRHYCQSKVNAQLLPKNMISERERLNFLKALIDLWCTAGIKSEMPTQQNQQYFVKMSPPSCTWT